MAGVKTDREKILEFLSDKPQGARAQDVANFLEKSLPTANAVLSPMVQLEYLERPEPGTFKITTKGLKSVGLDSIMAAPAPSAPITTAPPKTDSSGGKPPENPPTAVATQTLPTEYDKFIEIGRSVGIQEPFLKVATDSLFLGDVHDLKHVWKSLSDLYLRSDITKRIFNLWATFVNQPVPAEIADMVKSEPTKTAQAAAGEIASKRFAVINDEIVADPEGDFTYSQARQYLMTKVMQNAGVPQDKVSDLIAALTPFISKPAEQGTNINDVLLAILSKPSPAAPQPMSVLDVVQLVKALEKPAPLPVQPVSIADELSKTIALAKSLIEMAGSNKSENKSVTIPIKGMEGGLDLDTFFRISDHNRKIQQEEEASDSKKDTAKSVRSFVDRLGKAAEKFAEKEGGK